VDKSKPRYQQRIAQVPALPEANEALQKASGKVGTYAASLAHLKVLGQHIGVLSAEYKRLELRRAAFRARGCKQSVRDGFFALLDVPLSFWPDNFYETLHKHQEDAKSLEAPDGRHVARYGRGAKRLAKHLAAPLAPAYELYETAMEEGTWPADAEPPPKPPAYVSRRGERNAKLKEVRNTFKEHKRVHPEDPLCNAQIVVYYGDAKFAPTGRGETVVPTTKLYSSCAAHHHTRQESEYGSSQYCVGCGRWLVAVRIEGDPPTKVAKWLQCPTEGCPVAMHFPERIMPRDFVGTFNILIQGVRQYQLGMARSAHLTEEQHERVKAAAFKFGGRMKEIKVAQRPYAGVTVPWVQLSEDWAWAILPVG